MQWYEKNPKLYETEKERMLTKYPQAKETKLIGGNLAWVITMNLSNNNDFAPWTFLFVYKSDFSENSICDSINVVLLNPTYEQLKKRLEIAMEERSVTAAGVPHCMRTVEGAIHLSVRKPGVVVEQSAVNYVSAAAEWALCFELSMRDNQMFNKWVNNDYFDNEN